MENAFSSNGARSSWLGELDYLRGFAIIAIVAIHVLAFSTVIDHPNAVSPFTDYFKHLADFGVPLFFFISGFVLTMRYYDHMDRREFYRRRVLSILPPFLAFSAVYMAFNWFVLGQRSISDQLGSLILFDAVGAFWFVAVILQLYLLFPFLIKYYKRTEEAGRSWLLPLACLAIYVIWYGALEDWSDITLGAGGPLGQAPMTLVHRLFLPYLLFFVAGIYAFRNRAMIGRWTASLSVWPAAVPALLLALALQLLGSGLLWSLVLLPFAALMGALLYRISRSLRAHQGAASGSIRTIGVYSFGLYLVHMLAIAVVVNRLHALGFGAEDALFYILLLSGTIALSIVVIYVLDHLPYGKYISGIKGGSANRGGGRPWKWKVNVKPRT